MQEKRKIVLAAQKYRNNPRVAKMFGMNESTVRGFRDQLHQCMDGASRVVDNQKTKAPGKSHQMVCVIVICFLA